MIADLKPYLGTRGSGLPWLGASPADWKQRRLKSLLRPIDRRSSTGTETLLSLRRDHGIVVYSEHFSRPAQGATTVGYKIVHKGQLVVNRLQANNGLVFDSALDGLVSPDYSVFEHRGSDQIVMPYLSLLLRTPMYRDHFRRESTGLGTGSAGFLRLYDDRFLETPVVVPPVGEQVSILRFLDHADRRIRRYIRAKQQLVKLLDEQKQAIIHRTVTRGLDPTVRLRPSGVESLGDVPEHWAVKRLKWVTRLQRGYDLPADKRTRGFVPVVSSGGVIDTHSEARAQGPGVVMGRYGSTDAVFFMETDFWPHNTALFVTSFQGNDERWCYYLLRTISKADYSAKSAVPGVDRKDLFDIKVVVPPLNEQVAVARWIDDALAGLERTLEEEKRAVELIREYRTRLVADVVTGKIDVREEAARLPEEAEEPEPLDEADGGAVQQQGHEGVEALAAEVEV